RYRRTRLQTQLRLSLVLSSRSVRDRSALAAGRDRRRHRRRVASRPGWRAAGSRYAPAMATEDADSVREQQTRTAEIVPFRLPPVAEESEPLHDPRQGDVDEFG